MSIELVIIGVLLGSLVGFSAGVGVMLVKGARERARIIGGAGRIRVTRIRGGV